MIIQLNIPEQPGMADIAGHAACLATQHGGTAYFHPEPQGNGPIGDITGEHDNSPFVPATIESETLS